MADLDLRLVRYFTAVAEHRHFGRAAEALRIAQPSLSRQIRRLEQQVGARLLDRTPVGTQLTEAGAVFLPLARALLRSATVATTRAKAAAEPSRFTIGYTLHLVVTPAVRAMRQKHPDVDVRAMHVPWADTRAALLEHRVDVLVTRMPLAADQLHVTVLYDEPRGLLLPVDHRLAGKESVTLDDIADEPLPRVTDPAWNAFWRIEPRPDGRLAPDGPLMGSVEDKFELIASGEAIAIVPIDKHFSGGRADLTTVPLEGVEPSHVVLATRAGDRGRLVADFRKIAEAQLTAG
ncbi:LysR family transcriptional regulator [Amycolatopsis sp. K13G38]|uniref:LysR family transcriptional regulator n=1 Tax=Amycolatopsis acididurans TaxID=2724524 RepID=A0ABX1J5P0_9PSEU|nr:LysR family transcriptional regulator [Amycolatopsis acididurans]NKQ55128.1 LysR family transcriptional regulator [Amycolatopsis acididurans]